MASFFENMDVLTLTLDEDLSGANGDRTGDEVRRRLYKNIRKATHTQEADTTVSIDDAASLLLAMHQHMQEDQFLLQAAHDNSDAIRPESNALDLRRAIGLMVKLTMRVMCRRTSGADNAAV
jgi:hypothetical protein